MPTKLYFSKFNKLSVTFHFKNRPHFGDLTRTFLLAMVTILLKLLAISNQNIKKLRLNKILLLTVCNGLLRLRVNNKHFYACEINRIKQIGSKSITTRSKFPSARQNIWANLPVHLNLSRTFFFENKKSSRSLLLLVLIMKWFVFLFAVFHGEKLKNGKLELETEFDFDNDVYFDRKSFRELGFF